MLLAGSLRTGARSLSLAWLVIGCGGRAAEVPREPPAAVELSEEQFERARIEAGTSPESADETGGAWRVIEVPQLSGLRHVVKSPAGWLAVSRRHLGDGKAPTASQSVLYQSKDGVHWKVVQVAEGHDNLYWTGVAYRNGTYVVVGGRGVFGNDYAAWTSTDTSSWLEHPIPLDTRQRWGELVSAGEHFFALSSSGFGVSRDGAGWTWAGEETIQPSSVAHGHGRYVVVGTGPAQVSTDGEHWQSHPVECKAFGDCLQDPDGGLHPSPLGAVLFAEGRFHTADRVSDDGVNWEHAPGRSPIAYVSGRFLEDSRWYVDAYRSSGERERLRVTRPSKMAVTASGRATVGWLGRDGEIPELVDASFEDGLTCENATCLILGGRLLLVPPEGAAPLVDRVPRTGDGQPLLSDDCPVSRQIFCSDYAAREDCRCERDAPRSPESCPDVSQFECEDDFEARGEEWRVAEVGQGGCSCTAVDPNQPPTFGQDCSVEQSQCEAPLGCLAVDTASAGIPSPPRFICTAACKTDDDCPTWEASGFCAGSVRLRCSNGSCQPRTCD